MLTSGILASPDACGTTVFAIALMVGAALATSNITTDAAAYFGLPGDRTVIVGSHIEV
ncbi:hypothetical protein [Nocardia sp. NPDC049707]|uniref:hypothetical protein n=1 Tax=Nocardia sp. NPDC049707 TaxID=3154735 RepID=UPI0034285201